jgi:ribosomal-protein-alanine N-acetyltransferase
MDLRYAVRPMRGEDVPQVTEIDREAFPTQWSASSFARELNNRVAYYFVAGEDKREAEKQMANPVKENGALPKLVSKVTSLFGREGLFGEQSRRGGGYIFGFAGFWMMHDEAHLSTIAVRAEYRRFGIGEFLLVSSIEKAMECNAQVVTLEVRFSNKTARSLYEKYSFAEVGIRRGYYTDDGEDALIMTTEPITAPSFQSKFQQLKKTHAQRWGAVLTLSSNS